MTCCVTGHRPQKFPFEYSDKCPKYAKYKELLYNTVKQLINEGYDNFISGMANGADLDFAAAVIHCQENNSYNIKLEAALPYSKHSANTQKALEYNITANDCNSLTIVSEYYHKGCYQKRNKYMVDNSDLILAIWNGEEDGGTWNTIKYARKTGKKIIYIMLNKIED